MHALLVTYTSAVPGEAQRDAQIAFADLLATVPGFVSKTWLDAGARQGGFYLFEREADARAFASGPLLDGLRAAPHITDVTAQDFGVVEELGALTGAGGTASARAHAAPVPGQTQRTPSGDPGGSDSAATGSPAYLLLRHDRASDGSDAAARALMRRPTTGGGSAHSFQVSAARRRPSR